MKKNKNFGPCISAIFQTYCYYNFNPYGIFENMTLYLFTLIFNQELEQGKLKAAAGRFTKVKVQKTCVLYFIID